jgi:predicted glycoside hydrolase/deacetylase ChbG (UPF0249 family)
VVELDRIREPFLLRLLEAEARAEPEAGAEAEGQGEPAELGCHPGRVTAELHSTYTREREIEIQTLTDPALPSKIAALGWRFASYLDWRA